MQVRSSDGRNAEDICRLVNLLCSPEQTAKTPQTSTPQTEQKFTFWVLCSTEENNRSKWDSRGALIYFCNPVWRPHTDQTKHGKDFIRLVPTKASEVRAFASIKHVSLTKYAVLHQQGPPLRASSTQQTVCPAIALQCSLKREMNNSGYVL